MAVKYLSGNRLWGTNAERLALTTGMTNGMGSVADGTIYGADFDETAPNPFSTGWLDFVRANTDYCQANGAITAMSTKGTISAWFKFNQFLLEDTDDRVFEFGDTNAQNWFSVALNWGEAKLEITNRSNYGTSGNTAWTGESDTSSLTEGDWYHLVITHNETTPTIWLGKLGVTITDQTNLGTPNDATIWIFPTYIDNFNIGRQDHGSLQSNYLDGGVAEIAMWNEVLSDAEIQILHNNNGVGTALPQPADTYPTDLRVWFTFNPEDSMTNNAVATQPNLSNGTVFITSDTNVHYMWNSSAETWNEVA